MSEDVASSGNAHSMDQRKLMEEKRAEWDVITKKRMEMLEAGKKKEVQRKAEAKAQSLRQQEAFSAEVAAIKKRAEQREEWRQALHTAHEEDIKHRRELDVLKKKGEADALKMKAAENKRKEYLLNLHRTAVEQQIRTKREEGEKNAAWEQKDAAIWAERDLHMLDEETQRSLHHLDTEKVRMIAAAKDDRDRRLKLLHGEPATLQAGSRWKQEALALDEALQAKVMDIEEETKHLKAEILNNAQTKTIIIRKNEESKKQQAERRKEAFEQWSKEG